MSLVQRFLEHVRQHDVVPRGSRVVVACSGGGDSTALALLVAATRDALVPRALVLAHLDHGLRAASADESRAVAALARRYGYEARCERREVRRAAGESPEEAARRVRYAFLCDVARDTGATHVLTAHHMDDQAETVLQRVLRGTGPAGLGGIPERRPLAHGVALVRPLLPFRAAALRTWLRAIGVTWFEDPGNLDGNERARLRHAGIPALAACVERDPVPLLARLASNMAESSAPATRDVARAFVHAQPGGIVLHEGFARLPRALRAATLRESAPALRGDRPLTRNELDRLLTLVAGDAAQDATEGVTGEVTGLAVERRGRAWAIVAARPAPMAAEVPAAVHVAVPGATTIWDGRELVIDVVNAGNDAFLERLACRDGSVEIAAVDRLRAPFVVRARRDGDRLRPLGWDHEARLTHVLGRRGIAAAERRLLPLLCDADGIVWAVGVALADRVRVTADTRRIAVLRVTAHRAPPA